MMIKHNQKRLIVKIFKNNYINQLVIEFSVFDKYKRLPYYFCVEFLDRQIDSLSLQHQLAEYVLLDPLLLPFFRGEVR